MISPQTRKSPGQSLVEFALSITLVFLLVSAIIDLGLAFFAYQGIAGAAQEGATYAALRPLTDAGTLTIANNNEIRQRARYEGGIGNETVENRASFVNLLDLDNNGTVDSPAIISDRIRVKSVQNDNAKAVRVNPYQCEDASDGAGIQSPPQRSNQYCDMQVSIRYTYKPFFAFASLLGARSIDLRATRQVTISR